MKRYRSPVDAWLSPREAAELVLGHAQEPRSRRVIYNMQKRVQAACRIYRDCSLDQEHRAYFGLVCPPPRPNGRLEVKKSEVLRWAERQRIFGLVAAGPGMEATDARR